TISSSAQPSCSTTSARRSVPLGWSAWVNSTWPPAEWTASNTPWWSVATQTSLAPEICARSTTRITIGLPAMSASGLPGSRVEAKRAGMMTRKAVMAGRSLRRADLANGRASAQRVHFLGGQLQRLVLQHHRDAVADREGQAVRLADQVLLVLAVIERPLADPAHEDVKPSGVPAAVEREGAGE